MRLTDSELRDLAERTCQAVLGCSFAQALRELDAGELTGAPVESIVHGFRFLLADECDHLPTPSRMGMTGEAG